MSAGITVDYREWTRAITEYSAACNVELSYAMNRQTNNFLVKTLSKLTKASRERIEPLLNNGPFMRWLAETQLARFPKDWASAMAAAKGIIKKRIAAVTFLRAYVGSIIRQLKSAGGLKSGASGKSFTGFVVRVKEARPGSMSVDCSNEYEYKRKRASDQATWAEKTLQQAMDASVQETVQDMEQYTARKLDHLARQYSGARR